MKTLATVTIVTALLATGCAVPKHCDDLSKLQGTDASSVKRHNSCLRMKARGPVTAGDVAGAVVGGTLGLVAGGLANAGQSRSYAPRSVTTTFQRDRNGQPGRVSNRYVESRIRYSRDGSIREIKTRWK